MKTFLQRQVGVAFAIAAIVMWLVAFPAVLRLASSDPVNRAVTFATGAEPISVVRIEESGHYACTLVFAPSGTLVDEIVRVWETYVTRERLAPAHGFYLDIECTVWRVDRAQLVHSARTRAWADFFNDWPIHLTRMRTGHSFSFPLDPGVYAIKTKIAGDPSELARFAWSVRADLLPQAPPVPRLAPPTPWRAWDLLPGVNWLLFWVAAFLCVVLAFRLVAAALQPLVRRGRAHVIARSPALARFTALPAGKKKVVLALPVVGVSFALLYLPVGRSAYGAAGVAFILSMAVFVVGLIEMRWARGIAKSDAAMARLPSFARDLIALATFLTAIALAIIVVRFAAHGTL